MATTKTTTAMWDGQTLTAGAADTTSSVVTLTAGDGGVVLIKLTNGATGPTDPAQVQVQVSADNSEWYDSGGPLVGGTTASTEYSWKVDVADGVKYLRLVAGSNTDQDVTVDADIVEVSR